MELDSLKEHIQDFLLAILKLNKKLNFNIIYAGFVNLSEFAAAPHFCLFKDKSFISLILIYTIKTSCNYLQYNKRIKFKATK